MTAKVAVLVGSLRKGSINRQLAEGLSRLARGKLEFEILELGDLPHYNQDQENDLPAPVARFKKKIADADAVLFVSPEFNRSFPASIKNAIEWGSRPWGKSVWPGKPAAIVGATPGAIGTAVAQMQLRGVLTAIGMHVLGNPEIYLQYKDGHFVDGDVADEGLRKLLSGFVDTFADFVGRLRQ